jgi:hypothetical protein
MQLLIALVVSPEKAQGTVNLMEFEMYSKQIRKIVGSELP